MDNGKKSVFQKDQGRPKGVGKAKGKKENLERQRRNNNWKATTRTQSNLTTKKKATI